MELRTESVIKAKTCLYLFLFLFYNYLDERLKRGRIIKDMIYAGI